MFPGEQVSALETAEASRHGWFTVSSIPCRALKGEYYQRIGLWQHLALRKSSGQDVGKTTLRYLGDEEMVVLKNASL
jgi:hypothetical protein